VARGIGVKILVTDGHSRAALAVTRSLGRAGHSVIVGDHRTPTLAQTSRFCAGRVMYPDPMLAPDAFCEFVAGYVRDAGIEILVPVTDVTTLLLTDDRDRFEPACAIPLAPAAIVARAADKVDVVTTAARIGVPVPSGVVVNRDRSIPDLDFNYPVVVKPHRSRVRTAAGWRPTSVSYAVDRHALVRDLNIRPEYEFPVLVQERIDGPGIGIFACYQRGRAVGLFGHRRLRERPPWGGVSALSESVPLDPLARDAAVRLLDEIGWQGVAMVEFKRDLRDGIPKLMEINGRFWGSLQLAVDAGMDFPTLLIRAMSAEPLAAESYRIGIRSRWLWGDIDALLLVLIGRAQAMGAPQSRARALADFLELGGKDLYYENPRWDDLGPWWQETRERFWPLRWMPSKA
jgi:predicted ATP-grasp superfamily ATP-dependent carboligase